MAMLASKSPYGASVNGTGNGKLPTRNFSETSLRAQQSASALQDSLFMSPTDSDFSENYDGLESVRAWDEKKVGEWLHSIRCGQYEKMFRDNNFTGESLLECDQSVLTDMGIKKIGDRVRINVAIKQLRNKSVAARTQARNRESMAALAALSSTPTDSPQLQPRLGNKRLESARSNSRPSSPLAETNFGGLRSRYALASPADTSKREVTNGYFSQPNSASSVNGRRPETPQIVVQGTSGIGKSHLRQNSSIDGLTPGGLPSNSPVIKIVHNGGQTKVVNVKFCKSSDEVTMTVLKKLLIPEKHFRNYCFYVLEGLDAKQSNCRRITDDELMAICGDASRSERNRLILRKINDGLPDLDEVKKAAKLASDENQALHANALSSTNMRNQIKLQQLTGESWSNIQAPLSPGPMTDRHQQILQRAEEIERAEAESQHRSTKSEDAKIRAFLGGRPPSEMIVNELTTYFPGHQKEEIEKTMRMSVRRSQRLSRAASRLSVVSNISMASSMQDAPPVPKIPSIADQWLTKPGEAGIGAKPRPLSVSRLHNPYRDSIASSALAPLQEESPISPTEPNRKSYVSFADSSDSLHPDRHSYFEESPTGTENLNEINERLSMLVAEDGEEADPELANFLRGNNFDKNNWMKGDLIGEGSFGSVYLALHAVTGELMAVKQVELPDVGKGTESDKKKQSMVNALKLEIELLQGLHHPHIVQYLGASSDETHLNIFLEYVPGGSIAAMLKQYNTFKEPLTRNFTRQILDGLAYLHSRNIIHRDIKGANILVDNRGAVKISDFGVSKQTTSNLTNPSSLDSAVPVGPLGPAGTRTSLQGSVFWMAPEVVRQTGQSIKSDIWSVGCLIVEMFTGSRPFPSMTTLQTLFAVGSQSQKPQIPESASGEATRFLELCFEVDQAKRPSATELLKEPFCTQSVAGGPLAH